LGIFSDKCCKDGKNITVAMQRKLDGHCTQKLREMVAYKIMVRKPDGNKSLGRSTGKCESNIR
jgi:hypothetical protein